MHRSERSKPTVRAHQSDSAVSPPLAAVSPLLAEPLVAITVARGFAAGDTPAYDLSRIPPAWKQRARWMPWLPFRHRRWKWVARALLTPMGQPANTSALRMWVSYERALANAYAWTLGRQGGGIAYVYLDSPGDLAPRGVIFFAVPVREAVTTQLTILAADEPDRFPAGEPGGEP